MMTQDAAADLAYIRKIMEESRSFADVGGFSFVWWGSLVGLAALGTWFVLTGRFPGGGAAVGALWTVTVT
ncbi:MAG: hypothetical protein RML32_00065, partial [Gammaproteobacteria bacterium]|nr:hypothetical protein [Gammaproteobacteria bacterium]